MTSNWSFFEPNPFSRAQLLSTGFRDAFTEQCGSSLFLRLRSGSFDLDQGFRLLPTLHLHGRALDRLPLYLAAFSPHCNLDLELNMPQAEPALAQLAGGVLKGECGGKFELLKMLIKFWRLFCDVVSTPRKKNC